ncbi:hypothetical protein ABIA38_008139 [Embleya sp. AB8]
MERSPPPAHRRPLPTDRGRPRDPSPGSSACPRARHTAVPARSTRCVHLDGCGIRGPGRPGPAPRPPPGMVTEIWWIGCGFETGFPQVPDGGRVPAQRPRAGPPAVIDARSAESGGAAKFERGGPERSGGTPRSERGAAFCGGAKRRSKKRYLASRRRSRPTRATLHPRLRPRRLAARTTPVPVARCARDSGPGTHRAHDSGPGTSPHPRHRPRCLAPATPAPAPHYARDSRPSAPPHPRLRSRHLTPPRPRPRRPAPTPPTPPKPPPPPPLSP